MKAARKNGKRAGAPAQTAPAPVRPSARRWIDFAGFAAALYLVFQVYSPALHGAFLFDDLYLPFGLPNFPEPIRFWVTGGRPVLQFSYWLNMRWSGADPLTYHVLSVLIHTATSILVFFILRKFLDFVTVKQPRRDLLATFAAGVFLLHPVQTESVAYIAGRSDALSVLFLFSAFALFLYRRRLDITWTTAAAVLLLFGLALGSKEHSIVLPALLLLTDYYFNPGYSFRGIRRNWRLYGVAALGGLAGLYYFRRLFTEGGNAGFRLKDFTWYQYFFTQCRALFVYPRLFLFPAGQNGDYDFAISKSIFEHGAILGLIVLLALAGLAWWYRKRYPLASYGYFAYLLLMAPTSSFVPIKDAIAERRLYLSMIALLLITLEFLRRVRLERKALAALAGILAILAAATYHRAGVWSDSFTFWQDTIEKSPRKARPRFQLAYAYYAAGRCDIAIQHYEAVSRLEPPAFALLLDWALAYDCNNQRDLAIGKLQQAALIERNAPLYVNMAKIYAEDRKWTEALQALDTAQQIDGNLAATYINRGGVFESTNELVRAAEQYRKALALDPSNAAVREALARVEARLQAAH